MYTRKESDEYRTATFLPGNKLMPRAPKILREKSKVDFSEILLASENLKLS